MSIDKKSKVILLLFLSMGLWIYFVLKIPDNMNSFMSRCYNINLLSLFIMLLVINIVYAKFPLDIFDPFMITSGIYLMIFGICPLIDIINGETAIYGFDPMAGCIKGTLIFIISYLAFVFGYTWRKDYCFLNYEEFDNEILQINNRGNVILGAYILWVIGFMGTLIYMASRGMSLNYILTLGMGKNSDVIEASGTALGFLGLLTFTMITASIYICFYGKNKLLNSTIYIVTMMCLLVRGFRSIIIILLLAPIIYWYVKRNTRPGITIVLAMLGGICFMIGIVGFVRGDLRSGGTVSLTDFNIDVIVESVMNNFRRYNIFYGMVEALPNKHNYTFGENYLYTITMMVPRAIWPGKPQPVMSEILEVSTNKIIASTGAAWPNIGEYYMEFGLIGCIVFMYVLGRIFSRTRIYYNSSRTTIHSLMGYSVFIPSLVTIIAYGYTPSTAYMMLFLLLPVFVLSKVDH